MHNVAQTRRPNSKNIISVIASCPFQYFTDNCAAESLNLFYKSYRTNTVGQVLNEIYNPSDDRFALNRIIIKNNFIDIEYQIAYKNNIGLDIDMNIVDQLKILTNRKREVTSGDLKNLMISFTSDSVLNSDLESKHGFPPEQKFNPFITLVKSTKCIKNKFAAYKILMNIVYPRNRLHKMGFVDNPLCEFCSEIENKKHMLVECSQIEILWAVVAKLLTERLSTPCEITYKTIVYGWDQTDTHHKTVNAVINHFKMRIISRSIKVWTKPLVSKEIEFVLKNEIKTKDNVKVNNITCLQLATPLSS